MDDGGYLQNLGYIIWRIDSRLVLSPRESAHQIVEESSKLECQYSCSSVDHVVEFNSSCLTFFIMVDGGGLRSIAVLERCLRSMNLDLIDIDHDLLSRLLDLNLDLHGAFVLEIARVVNIIYRDIIVDWLEPVNYISLVMSRSSVAWKTHASGRMSLWEVAIRVCEARIYVEDEGSLGGGDYI